VLSPKVPFGFRLYIVTEVCKEKENLNLVLYIAYIFSAGRMLNTLRTGDADLRFYITTVQDG